MLCWTFEVFGYGEEYKKSCCNDWRKMERSYIYDSLIRQRQEQARFRVQVKTMAGSRLKIQILADCCKINYQQQTLLCSTPEMDNCRV